MELTLNTPPKEWYVETSANNLTYWRIDYPPLTAYTSLISGYLSNLYDRDSVILIESRGYENPSHKHFMRLTVLAADFLFFFTSFIYLTNYDLRKYSGPVRQCFILFGLLAPPFILIDSGHF